MVNVSPVLPNNVVQPGTTLEEASSTSVDYDSFLQLLVTQMKNQDPTKPMESTEYVAQLAGFSNVEQGVQINKKLDQMINSSFISNAGSLIGKTITTPDGNGGGRVVEVKVVNGVGTAVTDTGQSVAVNDGVIIRE